MFPLYHVFWSAIGNSELSSNNTVPKPYPEYTILVGEAPPIEKSVAANT